MNQQSDKPDADASGTLENATIVQKPGYGRDALCLLLIIATAFVLRLIYILQLRDNPYFDTPVMDPLYHHDWARAFAAGETFWDQAYFRAPLYPWFLGVIYKIFGVGNFMAARIVQISLGSLSCGMLYLVGRLVFSRSVALIAGLTAATYWIFMYFDGELLIPVLIIFLDLVLLWLLLWTGDKIKPLAWGVCGLALGVSAIARPNILLMAPPLVVWIFVMHRPRWRRSFGYAFCLFLGTIAPILPITIRNYAASQEFALIATQGGVNYYIGNNPDSDGKSAVIRGDPGAWKPCYQAQIDRAELALGRQLKATEVSQWYFQMALRFFRTQPSKALNLTLKKLGYFWSHYELWNNQDMRFVAEYHTPIARWLPVGFWLVGPLGVLGWCLCFARARRLFPLWGFVLIYMTSVVLFFVCARFRAPVAFVLVLLAAHAACWLVQSVRRAQWRKLTLAAFVLIVMGLIAARTPENIDEHMFQQHQATGMRLRYQKKFPEAEVILAEMTRRADAVGEPLEARVWLALALSRVEQDKHQQALAPLQRALEIRPAYPEALGLYGYVLTMLGRDEQALDPFQAMVDYDPDDAPARLNLTRVLLGLHRGREAMPHLIRAVEIDERNARVFVDVAYTLCDQDRRSDALMLLRAGVERFPENAALATALIRTLAESPSIAARVEAVRIGETACERTRYDDARILAATAEAQFSINRPEQAAGMAMQALEVARRHGLTELSTEIEQALNRYESGNTP